MIARIVKDDEIETITDEAAIRAAIASGANVWIQLEKQCATEDALLTEVLDIHPLTVEDIWMDRTSPKLEDYRKYLYILVHAVRGTKRVGLELIELDVVIGKTWLVTHDAEGEITK